MSAAHPRLAELLDRWLTSIEAHTRLLELDDETYAQVQDWPKHQRPTHWILDLARARLHELKRLLAERESHGDESFADALELMSFLTTLLGSEHIERFIPLVDPDKVDAPVPEPPPAKVTAVKSRPAARPASKSPPPRATPAADTDQHTRVVVGDAVRLLKWGREWPQLASLIARLADRPDEAKVWEILRAQRANIEAEARRAPR